MDNLTILEQFWDEAVQLHPELAGKQYIDIDAQFAFYYGEGDRTLAWWKESMCDYFVQECAQLGRQAAEDMPILCERFRVVYQKANLEN
jgi:uncharacterized protein YhfF